MDQAGQALGPSNSGFKNHGTYNAPFPPPPPPFFSRLEFCTFLVEENTVVLNVEWGDLNVRRWFFRGFKACGKHTLPRIYMAHLALTTHLMRLLTAYPYKWGYGFR